MKFDNTTLQVLKNFSTINQSIVVKEGNILSSISPSRSVLAKATLKQNFPQDFAIFDLSKFLSTMSLFDDAEFEFSEKFLTIKKDKAKVKYYFAEPSMILTPPDKEIKLPSEDIVVDITEANINDVMKGLSVLQLPEIAVIGDGEMIRLVAIDSVATGKENKVSDSYSIDLCESEKEFTAVFKAENIKMIPSDYVLTISSKYISKFSNDFITYWVAIEKNKSSF